MNVYLNKIELDLIKESLMERIYMMEMLINAEMITPDMEDIHANLWILMNKFSSLRLKNVKSITSSD